MVLQQIGLPLEGIALILGVDRLLDMCRTTVNITGDSSAAVIVAATEGELDASKLASAHEDS
jgi:Na+/H+-dicarboxylate symporter